MDPFDMRSSRQQQASEIYLDDEDSQSQRSESRFWSSRSWQGHSVLSGRLEVLQGLPLKRIAGASLLLLAFLSLRPFFLAGDIHSGQEVANARSLISNRWKGLDSNFASQELPKSDLRPQRPGIPETDRKIDQDFRQVEVARDVPALEAYYQGTSVSSSSRKVIAALQCLNGQSMHSALYIILDQSVHFHSNALARCKDLRESKLYTKMVPVCIGVPGYFQAFPISLPPVFRRDGSASYALMTSGIAMGLGRMRTPGCP